jgi:nucleoside-diphosphate-sugar epimerase/carbamoylphosphate synthase large subunit
VQTIGISCVGSGVGQSIVSSLNLSRLPLIKIGFGNDLFAFGSFDCDKKVATPSIYSPQYAQDLLELCIKNNVEILIPGLDDEALVLSRYERAFTDAGIGLICSSEALISLCRNKQEMGGKLKSIKNVFVDSYDVTQAEELVRAGVIALPLIAKPRGGFASRGVEILLSVADFTGLKGDYIVQSLAIPAKSDPNYLSYLNQLSQKINPQLAEISIQVVYGPNGDFLGRMASYNKLENGVPIQVLPIDNDEIWEAVDELTPELLRLGLRGPLNIQGRLTQEGLKIFEMNARFTGITGLRALMGFNEVEACIRAWSKTDAPTRKLAVSPTRFGVRQTLDKAISISKESTIQELTRGFWRDNSQKTKRIFISGASGYLGRYLISQLQGSHNLKITAFGRDLNRLKASVQSSDNLTFCDPLDLASGNISFGDIDVFLHLASARPHNSSSEIAESTRFTAELLATAASHHVPLIINISSQSVYGENYEEQSWTEISQINPVTAYSQSKFASEILLKSLQKIYPHITTTSIRLGSLAGVAPQALETDVISKLLRKGLDNEQIVLTQPDLLLQRLDIHDAVEGITRLIHLDQSRLPPIMNFTSPDRVRLSELAEYIIKELNEHNLGLRTNIVIKKSKKQVPSINLVSDLFFETVDWRPSRSLKRTIESIVQRTIS